MVFGHGPARATQDVLSGAVDIIVLRCSDGTLRSSPFICRFGRFKCIRSYEKIVRIEINGELNPDVYMKIGSAGEAYFIVVAKVHAQLDAEFFPVLPNSSVSSKLTNHSVVQAKAYY